jgi:hypothetical protein
LQEGKHFGMFHVKSQNNKRDCLIIELPEFPRLDSANYHELCENWVLIGVCSLPSARLTALPASDCLSERLKSLLMAEWESQGIPRRRLDDELQTEA